MPMDGVMLGFIARELRQTLLGGRVDKAAQPERDEVILTIRNHGANHQLLLTSAADSARACLTREKFVSPLEPPMFCMLLRKYVVGARVEGVRQINGDRILEIEFSGEDELGESASRTLVCEFMGRHSNIILTSGEGTIIDSARRVTSDISRVREVLPGLRYERPPAQDKLPYDALTAEALAPLITNGTLSKALSERVSGLSAQTAREIALRAAGDAEARITPETAEAAARAVAGLIADFPDMAAPSVAVDDEGTAVDVVPFDYLTRAHLERRRFATASEAVEAYCAARDKAERVKQKAASLNKTLKNNIERCEKKAGLQMQALMDSERMEEYRVKGELLTASLRMVTKGAKVAELPNYYDPECKTMTIELQEKLSPAQNAQRYFKLYQKAKSAKELATEQLKKTREELYYLEGQLSNLQNCEDEPELFEIRAELEAQGYLRANRNRRQMKKLPPSAPLSLISSEGCEILVGKNNIQNDKLTGSARPDEWWLHIKDMPGSHVIVRDAQAGERTLSEAAAVAAYYSKARDSSRASVDYTRRKYVKKPSGAKPGFVTYTHQRTIYVQPSPDIRRSV